MNDFSKSMPDVSVETIGDEIIINQADYHSPEGKQTICIHPDQLEVVIDWLRDAKAAIFLQKKASESKS